MPRTPGNAKIPKGMPTNPPNSSLLVVPLSTSMSWIPLVFVAAIPPSLSKSYSMTTSASCLLRRQLGPRCRSFGSTVLYITYCFEQRNNFLAEDELMSITFIYALLITNTSSSSVKSLSLTSDMSLSTISLLSELSSLPVVYYSLSES